VVKDLRITTVYMNKLTSISLRSLKLHEFTFFYWQAHISQEVEKIVALVLKEAYIKGETILVYRLDLPEEYYKYLIDKLKSRLQLTIYVHFGKLYIDWTSSFINDGEVQSTRFICGSK